MIPKATGGEEREAHGVFLIKQVSMASSWSLTVPGNAGSQCRTPHYTFEWSHLRGWRVFPHQLLLVSGSGLLPEALIPWHFQLATRSTEHVLVARERGPQAGAGSWESEWERRAYGLALTSFATQRTWLFWMKWKLQWSAWVPGHKWVKNKQIEKLQIPKDIP